MGDAPHDELLGGRLSASGLRYYKLADRHPRLQKTRLSGFILADLDEYGPRRVPRRYRRRFFQDEPHRAPAPRRTGPVGKFFDALMLLWSVPAGLGGAIAAGIVFGPFRLIARLVHGPAWQGGWDSEAGRFLLRVRAGRSGRSFRNTSCLLAFAPGGLLVLDRPLLPEDQRPFLLAELQHGDYSLRREAHPARHEKRVDIAFSDGSWLALDLKEAGDVPEVEQLLRSR